jgi:hypothetical protein
MNRGDRREATFKDGMDKEGFLETRGEVWGKPRWADSGGSVEKSPAPLANPQSAAILPAMKLLSATLVYLVFAVLIGWGTVLLMAGKPGLLIAAVGVYTLLFAKVGCASH